MKLAFYKAPGSWWDALIRWQTWGPYSHAELVFDNGEWFSSAPEDGGTRFKRYCEGFSLGNPEDKKIQQRYGTIRVETSSEWDFVEVPARIGDEAKVYLWCESELNCPYDWAGVLRFAFPFLKPSPNKWFCSEVCIAALQQIGLFTGIKPAYVSPNRLYRIATGQS
jgi:hypothetical protein